jgi:glycosyltransferase involved in cell wall biosynthesis
MKLAVTAGIGDRISVKSYVSESELTRLYAKATVFVFLSEYEGFGFPPLEAMAAGIPTIVGDTEVARELYMSASIRVPVDDVIAIAAGIRQLLQDSGERATLLSAAAARLPHFTWKRAAADTLRLLGHAGSP